MLYAIVLFSFAAISCILYIGLNIALRQKIGIKSRIEKFISAGSKDNGTVEGTMYERILEPAAKRILGLINKVTPKHYYLQLEKKLREAGNPMNLKAEGLVFLQAGIFLLTFLLIAVLWVLFKAPVTKIAAVAAMAFALVYLFPKLYIRQKIQQRQKEMEKSLPDVLDLLTVSIEAGLSFDGALAKLVEKMSGGLVDEFAVVLKEMRVGVSKRDAFKAMVERVPAENLITFVGAILQADQLGVSIGNVLRIQATQVRLRRRQKAQEAAMKAPIKMLFPMVFFIMPTIFIVLLGPAIIKTIQFFSGQ